MSEGKFLEVEGFVNSGHIEYGGQILRNVHVPGVISEYLRNIEVPEWKLVGAGVDLTEALPIAITVQANPNAFSLEMLGFRIVSGTVSKSDI